MKPIYKSLLLESIALSVTLSLQANVTSGEDTATQAVQAESLEGLKVGLISPNVSGVRDLLASGEATLDENHIAVNLNGLAQGVHRLQVSAVFGTQTVVLYALDITVPTGTLESEPREYDDEIVVVSTFGDGDKSGADAEVYAKDEDGHAHITTPLSIGDGAATGNSAVTAGQISGDSQINAISAGSVAIGAANEGAVIESGNGGAIAAGIAGGEGSNIQASGAGSIAAGSVDSESTILTNGAGSFAIGVATGAQSHIDAHADGSIAHGLAQNGGSITAQEVGSLAGGVTYGEDAKIEAGEQGSITHGYASGEEASLAAHGNGAIAIGLADGDGATIVAGGEGAMAVGCSFGDDSPVHAIGIASQAMGTNVTAAGNYSCAQGSGTNAQGIASHAEGDHTIASGDFQHVSGKFNVNDTNGDYALIVGNGTADDARSNAFAIDWNGNLVLFDNGTPVVLTPAKLAQLIA